MKALLFGSLFFAATSLSAQTPSGSGPAEGSSSPSDIICRTSGETGSRLQRTRVCRTRAEWDAQRRDNRQAIDRAQNTRTTSGQ